MNLPRRVGIRIKAIRKQRRLTQQQLAERLERTIDAVSQLERGLSLPSFGTLERLSTVLGVSIREFFDPSSADSKASAEIVRLRAELASIIPVFSAEDLRLLVEVAQSIQGRNNRGVRDRRGQSHRGGSK